MTRSPGHQKWPEHKVEEKPLDRRIQVSVGDAAVADSRQAIEVDEDDHRPRYYIPRSDVSMDMLQASKATSKCPFKGQAHYFNVKVDGETIEDAAWSYEDPYDEHRSLKDFIAFHDEKPNIEVRSG